VFSVSVGNLPSQSDVIIKITYVTELAVGMLLNFNLKSTKYLKPEGSNICFVLPSTVSPPTKKKGLDQVTQSTTQTVSVEDDGFAAADIMVSRSHSCPSYPNN